MSSKGPARRGLLLVVSAPSGTGKTTVVERLVQVVPDLALSRSYTSRSLAPISSLSCISLGIPSLSFTSTTIAWTLTERA